MPAPSPARHVKRIKARLARKAALAAGLCGSCWKRPLVTRSRCEICRENAKAYGKARRAELVAQGLCVKCGKVRPAKGLTCDECLKPLRRYCAKVRAAKVEARDRREWERLKAKYGEGVKGEQDRH